jgi:hypothetical protein
MRLLCLLLTLAGTAPVAAQTAAPQPVVDTAGVGRLVDQAMNRSEVMRNLQVGAGEPARAAAEGAEESGSTSTDQTFAWVSDRAVVSSLHVTLREMLL